MTTKTNTDYLQMGFRQADGDTQPAEIYIYDAVTDAEYVDWETMSIKESETGTKMIRKHLEQIKDGTPIELHINSCGGDVGTGTAIYNLLRAKSDRGSKITAYVDGYAYSIALTIACAGDEIVMGPGTSMLLHYPWCMASGNASALRTVADQLDALGDASVQLYLARANRHGDHITETELREMMRAETVLDPQTALRYGFCDMVSDLPAEPKETPRTPEKASEDTDQQDRKNCVKDTFLAAVEAAFFIKS